MVITRSSDLLLSYTIPIVVNGQDKYCRYYVKALLTEYAYESQSVLNDIMSVYIENRNMAMVYAFVRKIAVPSLMPFYQGDRWPVDVFFNLCDSLAHDRDKLCSILMAFVPQVKGVLYVIG